MNRSTLRSFLHKVMLTALPLSSGAGGFCAIGCPIPFEYSVAVDGGVGALDDAGCARVCATNMFDYNPFEPLMCTTGTLDGGAPGVVCHTARPCEGRRTEGIGEMPSFTEGSEAARFFAEAAWLEAVSVHAFTRLAMELHAHGAPDALVSAARRSAHDEIRHARTMRGLARRAGAAPVMPEIDLPSEARTLSAIAEENAVEGCVRETFGAGLALFQARTAADPRLGRTYSVIADDELRHAELAWRVDRWARARLSPTAKRRVNAARARESEVLATELREPSPPLRQATGLPTLRQSRHLVAACQSTLWS